MLTRRVVSIVQARMGSIRLPGKSMLHIGDQLLIDHVLERALKAREVQRVYLATTDLPEDDVLVKYVGDHYPVTVHRGSAFDVRSRFLEILRNDKAEIVVRITADDPFKDPQETDDLIRMLFDEKLDYICNFAPQTLPIGLDVEVFTSSTLFDSASRFDAPQDQEHVTWNLRNQRYKWRSQTNRTFKPETRLTVDNHKDLDYCSEIANTIRQNSLGLSIGDTCRAIEITDRNKRI